MRSATYDCELPHKTQSMSLQSVRFKDGMVITADDLDTAMRYPLGVFQTLVRAYFGCGIVCGLEIRDPGAENYQPVPDRRPQPNFVVCIEPGVALGCDGYPIQLCAPIKLDLTPDPCCNPPPEEVYIAIRRRTSDDAPRQDCGCQSGNCGCGKNGSAPSCQDTRIRDHVEIKVFKKPGPPGRCGLPEPATAYQQGGTPAGATVVEQTLCDCLKECSGCDPHGESWVLLGRVKIPKIEVGHPPQHGISLISPSLRKHVKPIQCICEAMAGAGRAKEATVDAKPPKEPPVDAKPPRESPEIEAALEARLKAYLDQKQAMFEDRLKASLDQKATDSNKK